MPLIVVPILVVTGVLACLVAGDIIRIKCCTKRRTGEIVSTPIEDTLSIGSISYSSLNDFEDRLSDDDELSNYEFDNDVLILVTGDLVTTNMECPICLEEYVFNDIINLSNCGHTFHRHCLEEWHQKSRTCPTCQPSALN